MKNATATYLYGPSGGLLDSDADEQKVAEWALGNCSGGTIVFKVATYSLVGLDEDSTGVFIVGESWDTIFSKDGNGDILTLSGSECQVWNIQFDGNKGSYSGDNVVLSGSRTRARNILSEDADEAAVEMSAAGGAFLSNSRLDHTSSVREAGTIGVEVTSTAADNEIINCIISECEKGIENNGGTTRMTLNHIWGCTVGIDLSPDNSRGEAWIGPANFIEDNKQEAIRATGHTIYATTIQGNLIDGNCHDAGYSSIRMVVDDPYVLSGISIDWNMFDNVTYDHAVPQYHVYVEDGDGGADKDIAYFSIQGNNFFPEAISGYGGTWNATNPAVYFPDENTNYPSKISGNIGYDHAGETRFTGGNFQYYNGTDWVTIS